MVGFFMNVQMCLESSIFVLVKLFSSYTVTFHFCYIKWLPLSRNDHGMLLLQVEVPFWGQGIFFWVLEFQACAVEIAT